MLFDNDMVPYVTSGGERWDNIAAFAYGNPALTKPIIACNTSVPLTYRLPAGITIMIPVLSADDKISLPIASTPPWRQI